MKLAKWEQEWLQQMGQAFRGSGWDQRWLRNIKKKHIPSRPYRRTVEIVPKHSHPQMSFKDREIFKRAMMRAAQIVCRAIKSGKLPKLKGLFCADCKTRPAISYEHRDYSKPLEVEPICRRCNLRRGPAILSTPVPTRKRKAA